MGRIFLEHESWEDKERGMGILGKENSVCRDKGVLKKVYIVV